jgi:hypothetical protein
MVCPLQAAHDSFPGPAPRTTILTRSAPDAPKEVALVNSTLLWMTAQAPSAFGMPISGHTIGATTRATDVCTAAATLVVRDREATIAGRKGAVKGDMGLAQSYFPGTTAWRPPTC